jgi:hypothetical protein
MKGEGHCGLRGNEGSTRRHPRLGNGSRDCDATAGPSAFRSQSFGTRELTRLRLCAERCSPLSRTTTLSRTAASTYPRTYPGRLGGLRLLGQTQSDGSDGSDALRPDPQAPPPGKRIPRLRATAGPSAFRSRSLGTREKRGKMGSAVGRLM